ncbi:MAG: hypothetical protein IPN97_04840 [Saprospiraceae bacterium]|nr:hypothetical protein [Saprospiraceae bacterium]
MLFLLRTAKELEDSWSLRKNGLGLIMGDPEEEEFPFIEIWPHSFGASGRIHRKHSQSLSEKRV